MGLDRDKILAAAERQLKAGRTEAAVGDLRRLASSAPNDPSLLNRIGDFLSRARRVDESLEYYDRAADRFARSGLYPKAIAVGKKILRLRPDRVETLVTVGEWYLEQKLPGEARSFLLHAADHFLEARSFDRARGVYERLVEADPGDPRHRARLAEALAAEGKLEEAGHHMLALASSAEGDARESVYRRAMELLPGRDEPIRGLVDVLVASDREQDAVDFLEARARDGEIGGVLRAELAILYERLGRGDDALETFSRVDPVELPVGLVERFARARLEQGGVDGFWECFDRRSQEAGGAGEATVRLLERLSSLESSGHVPALERLVELRDGDARIATLGRLEEALRRSGRSDAAVGVAERLAELRGPDAVERGAAEDGAEAESEPDEASALEAVDEGEAAGSGGTADVPVEVEAPAVPLNRSDGDFVAGRLTQAEILEKYGLRDQAIEQVREVVGRFPGHVDAQSRLVRLLEEGGSAADLRDALVQEAFALRAAGESEAARRSARRAVESAPLDEDTASLLAALGLHRPVEDEASGDADREAPAGRDASGGVVVEAPGTPEADEDDEVLIDFEDDGDKRAPLGAAADADADPGADEASEPDDLTVLAEALESEALAGNEDDGWVPEAPEEQSLEDVLSAFKDRVQEEVEADDFRTHYDLAIGYKEMGMLDEAVSSFEIATRSPELRLEALILMAVIRREQGRPVDAARLYREALDAASQDAGSMRRLRYDLADTLSQAGDDREALEVFRELLEVDPQFRDVGVRVEEIERRLHG